MTFLLKKLCILKELQSNNNVITGTVLWLNCLLFLFLFDIFLINFLFYKQGDLMADLHAKLAMRRKGISGTKVEEGESGSPLDKLSAMIPPPLENGKGSSTNTEDEDWDE